MHESSVAAQSRPTRRQRVEAYVAQERKSPILAFVLVLVFGPVGYAYVNGWVSFLGAVLVIGLGFFYWPAAVVVWLLLAVYVPRAAKRHNRRMRRKGRWVVM